MEIQEIIVLRFHLAKPQLVIKDIILVIDTLLFSWKKKCVSLIVMSIYNTSIGVSFVWLEKPEGSIVEVPETASAFVMIKIKESHITWSDPQTTAIAQ